MLDWLLANVFPLVTLAVLALAFIIFLRHRRRHPILRKLLTPLVLCGIFFLLTVIVSRLEGPPVIAPADPAAADRLVNYAFFFLLFSAAVFIIRLAVALVFEVIVPRYFGVHTPALLRDVLAVVGYLVAFFVILKLVLSVSLASLLVTSSVLTVLVGLALQDTLSNLFSGLSLHMDDSCRIGHWVAVGEIVGRIEGMNWRVVKLLTIDNDYVVIPNNRITRELIHNLSHPAEPHARRLTIGVSYAALPGRVISLLEAIAVAVPGVCRQPAPSVIVTEYGDFAITYELRYWLNHYPLHRQIEGEIRRRIYYDFRRHGVEIPFPIRNVYLHQPADKEADRGEQVAAAQQLISGVDLFQPLTPDERQTLARQMVPLNFTRDEVILREGDAGDTFYVIHRGQVEVTVEREGAGQRRLGQLKAGEFFGEMALLTGQRRAATVRALTDVELFALGRAPLQRLLEQKPEMAEGLSLVVAGRREEMERRPLTESMPALAGRDEREYAQGILGRIRAYFRL